MKASLKFRDDKKPLFRSKIPLNVLGFPFQSGVSAGDSKELCLNLTTFFESGPSFKIAYHPNDSWNPFSFVVKTGIGSFGSPISAPLAISAEFYVLGRGNPSFFLRFKPRIGDFSIKKSVGSPIDLPSVKPLVFNPKMKAPSKDPDSDVEGLFNIGETSLENGVKVDCFPAVNNGVCTINRLFDGIELNARTVLPLRNCAELKFRWGVKFPAELKTALTTNRIKNTTAEILLRKIPFLVLDKISIEHKTEESPAENSRRSTVSNLPINADVAEMCFTVKSQLETLQAENGLLRKAVEEIRSEIYDGKSPSVTSSQDSGKFKETDVAGI